MGAEIFLWLMWFGVAAYIVMQIVVLIRSSGRARIVAGLPLILMIPIYAFTVYSYVQQSNLWPLLLLFASPVALVYVLFVAVALYTSKSG